MIPDVSGFATSADLNSLKTSVSSGKSIIATAVTDKGVSTAADASFQTIANNVRNIQSIINKYWHDALYKDLMPTSGMSVSNLQDFSLVEFPETIVWSYGNRTLHSNRIYAMGGNTDYAYIPAYYGDDYTRNNTFRTDIGATYYGNTNELVFSKPTPSNGGYSGHPLSTGEVIPYIGSDGCLWIKYPFNSSGKEDGETFTITSGPNHIIVKSNSTTCPLPIEFTERGAIKKAVYIPWDSMIMK